MAEIHRRDLAAPIIDFIRSNRPFLGICLGLQLLFERGFENGEHEGLGVLKGDVVRFDLPPSYKVPHMGWNTVTKRADAPILADTPENSHFYFVHSFYVRPADPSIIALECDYGGKFCAMVRQDNLFATQFHPEKSQTNGLKILKAFEQINQDGENGDSESLIIMTRGTPLTLSLTTDDGRIRMVHRSVGATPVHR